MSGIIDIEILTGKKCPYCGAAPVLIDSIEVYDRSYGMIWICRPCEAWAGVHKNKPGHIPLGRLANANLRYYKKSAHGIFDTLWKSGRITRKDAYAWLSAKMKIEPDYCHIGMFDVDQCKEVLRLCNSENARPTITSS